MQQTDPADDRANFARPDDVTRFAVELAVSSERAAPWTLRIRQPGWALEAGQVTVDGAPVAAAVSPEGFLEITREWKSARVRVTFPRRVTAESLPGDSRRFALLDGPVVLAVLTDTEPEIHPGDAITPRYEHQYVEGRDWQSGHFIVRARHGSVAVKPLHEIADEAYTVHFTRP